MPSRAGKDTGVTIMLTEWTFYFRTVDDSPATIGLFTDISEPIPAYPHLACVILTMQCPSEHGMSDTVEPDKLDVIDDQLGEHLLRTVNALYVGRMSKHGERTLYYYIPSTSGLKSAVQQLMANYPSYRYRLSHRIDPQWTEYFDWLKPKKVESWFVRNLEMIDNMEAEGDDLEVAREIDHWAHFTTKEARSGFLETVKLQGFQLRNAWLENEKTVKEPFGIQFYRAEPLTFDQVQHTVEFLCAKADDFHGTYDGWKAYFVVRELFTAVN